MAEFNRRELKKIFEAAEIEVPKDVLGQLCDLHADSSDGMGDTIKELKKQLSEAQRERDEAIEKAPKDGEETVSKAVYDKLKGEFDTYKQGVEEKETTSKKREAARELLKAAGISEKRLDSVLRVYNVDGMELDENGKAKDADKRTEDIKKEWADFIVSSRVRGADTANHPNNTGGGMSKAEIVKIKDPTERRAAIAANMELFEKGNDE